MGIQDPFGFIIILRLGKPITETGQYRKEKNLYKKAEQDFPDDR